jgi:hypothetical protein
LVMVRALVGSLVVSWSSSRRAATRLALALACGLFAWLSATAAAAPSRFDPDYLVRVSAATPAIIGNFSERDFSGDAAQGLRDTFGAPNSVVRPQRYTCSMRWTSIGLRAEMTDYGQSGDPCAPGYFLVAHLRGSWWHTPKGLHIGSRSSVARHQSVCGRLRCQTRGYPKGYVLGVHHIDCAPGLFPNVIAVVRRGRVVSLWVYSHGCE